MKAKKSPKDEKLKNDYSKTLCCEVSCPRHFKLFVHLECTLLTNVLVAWLGMFQKALQLWDTHMHLQLLEPTGGANSCAKHSVELVHGSTSMEVQNGSRRCHEPVLLNKLVLFLLSQ